MAKAPVKPATIKAIVVRGTVHIGEHDKTQAKGPGDLIELPEDEMDGLIARGVARLPDGVASSPVSTPPAEPADPTTPAS